MLAKKILHIFLIIMLLAPSAAEMQAASYAYDPQEQESPLQQKIREIKEWCEDHPVLAAAIVITAGVVVWKGYQIYCEQDQNGPARRYHRAPGAAKNHEAPFHEDPFIDEDTFLEMPRHKNRGVGGAHADGGKPDQLSFSKMQLHEQKFNRAGRDTLLNAPKSTLQNGLYHMQSNQHDLQDARWSCGFHALKNAYDLEVALGLKPRIDFMQRVRTFCGQHGIGVGYVALNTRQTEQIARHLGLSMCNLQLKGHEHNGAANRLLAGWDDVHFSSIVIHTAFLNGVRQTKVKADQYPIAQQFMMVNPGKIKCTHFGCHVEVPGEGPHVIDVSVVVYPDRRAAIYIWDNLNDKITEKSELYPYLNDIYAKLFAA